MKTAEEVSAWCAAAAEQFGDPSLPICQIFCRWSELPQVPVEEGDLACGAVDGQLVLLLGPEFAPFPMPIESAVRVDDEGVLQAFRADQVTPGVWALEPSLNAQGAIHAFVVLHGVPDPAPWEKRIVIP
jgi:hypothetical protein